MSVVKFRKKRCACTPAGLVDILSEDVVRLGADQMVVIIRGRDGDYRSYWTDLQVSELAGLVMFLQAHVTQEIIGETKWMPPGA